MSGFDDDPVKTALSKLPGASLSAYEPSWKDTVANWLLGDSKPSPEKERFVSGLVGSKGLGSTGMSVSDFVPIYGQGMAAQEAYHEGRPISEVALNFIPGESAAMRGALTAAREAAPVVESAVDLARRQLFTPSSVSAQGPVIAPNYEGILNLPLNRREATQAIAAAPVAAKAALETVPQEFSNTLSPLLDKDLRLSEVAQIEGKQALNWDLDTFLNNSSAIVKNVAKNSEGGQMPSADRLVKILQENYNPKGLLKNVYGFSDEEIPSILSTKVDNPNPWSDNKVITLEELLDTSLSDAHDNVFEHSYRTDSDFHDELKNAWKEGQLLTTKSSKVEEPTLSLSEQRQIAQDRIKELRTQLNAIEKGTPEYDVLKSQISEEGAKLGQLRGPAQEVVAKEPPLVDIKSYTPSGLYNKAEEEARRLRQAGTPEDVVNALINRDVKKDELIDARVIKSDGSIHPEFTNAMGGKADPEAVADYIAQNSPILRKRVLSGDETQYGDEPNLKEHLIGGTNYRENLYYFDPHESGIQYEGGHWQSKQPGTAMHARVEDTPDALWAHEIQGDQGQQGRIRGFADPEAFNIARYEQKQAIKAFEGAQRQLDDFYRETISNSRLANALDNPRVPLESIATTILRDNPEGFAKYKELKDIAGKAAIDMMTKSQLAATEAANIKSGAAIPTAPHVQDTGAWTRAIVKELLSETIETGKNKMIVSGGNVQNKRYALGGDFDNYDADLTHYYNNVVPSEIKTVLKALDPEADMDKVVRVVRSKPTDEQIINDPTYQIAKQHYDELVEVKNNYPTEQDIAKMEYNHTYYPEVFGPLEEQIANNLDDMAQEIAEEGEKLMTFWDRRDRIEVNLTPKMVEAIKARKMTKYFQGGRVP